MLEKKKASILTFLISLISLSLELIFSYLFSIPELSFLLFIIFFVTFIASLILLLFIYANNGIIKEEKNNLKNRSQVEVSIQRYFNKLIIFIDRILKRDLNSYSIISNKIEDLQKDSARGHFNITISIEGGQKNYFTIEFLNGEYILRIELFIGNIDIYLTSRSEQLFKLEERRELINKRVKILEFYMDLKDHIELTLGYSCMFPDKIETEWKKLEKVRSKFQEGLDLIIDLLAHRTSGTFATRFSNSEKLQEVFGVIIKNPQSDNLVDENFYFLNGKYYFIPNSAFLRIKTEGGQYNGYANFLTPKDNNQLKNDRLNQLIQEIEEFIEEKYNFSLSYNPKKLDKVFE